MIVVTGSTGFLGSHTIPLLVKEGIGPLRCFVRKTSDISLLKQYPEIEIVHGSFEDKQSIVDALQGADCLINIASLGFGDGPQIVDACEEVDLKRAIFISTTAMFTNLNAGTKVIRQKAEKKIIESNIQHTILRPTMIYGTHKDRNMARLVKVLKKVPAFPIFGSGKYLQQPIQVDDLAQAIIDAYKSTKTLNNEYNLSGEYPISYNEVIDQTSEALGKKVVKIHFPLTLTRLAFRAYEKVSKNPKLKEEQVLRLNEDKAFPSDKAARDFGFTSRSFKEGIKEEVQLMRKKNLL